MNSVSVMNLFADTIVTSKFPGLSQPFVSPAEVFTFEAIGRRMG